MSEDNELVTEIEEDVKWQCSLRDMLNSVILEVNKIDCIAVIYLAKDEKEEGVVRPVLRARGFCSRWEIKGLLQEAIEMVPNEEVEK